MLRGENITKMKLQIMQLFNLSRSLGVFINPLKKFSLQFQKAFEDFDEIFPSSTDFLININYQTLQT